MSRQFFDLAHVADLRYKLRNSWNKTEEFSVETLPMPSVSVGCYSVRVYQSGSNKKVNLGDAGEVSTYKSVSATLAYLKRCRRHRSEPHLLRVTELHKDRRSICGIVERGEFGFTASGVNADSFAETFRRRADDAELIPFYFRFYLPDDDQIGTLIIQRLGVHSAFSDLREEVTTRFEHEAMGYKLRFSPLVPSEVVQQLLNGRIHEVSVIQHTVPRDLASRLQWGGSREELGRVEIRLQAKRNHFLDFSLSGDDVLTCPVSSDQRSLENGALGAFS